MMRESGRGRQRCSCQCHWDLSWVHFGDSRIAVTDVDGLFAVERKGQILFIETKRIDEAMTRGQDIMLLELSRKRGFTVVAVYGDNNTPEVLRVAHHGEWLEVQPTDKGDFQRRVNNWFGRACRRPSFD